MMVLVRIDSQSVVMALMQSSGGSRRGFPSAFRDMSLMMQSTCAVSVRWLQVVVTGSHVQLAHVTITIRCAPPVCRARRLDSAAAAVPARRRPRSFAVDRLHQLLSFAELCRAVVDGLAGQQQLHTDTGGIVSFYVTATQTLTGAFIVSFSCPSAYVIRENKFDCFGRKRWKPFPGLCTPDPHHRDAYTK